MLDCGLHARSRYFWPNEAPLSFLVPCRLRGASLQDHMLQNRGRAKGTSSCLLEPLVMQQCVSAPADAAPEAEPQLVIMTAALDVDRASGCPLSCGCDTQVYITGSPEALGCWQTQSAMPMTRTQGTLWEADVCLPRDEFPIRYPPHRPYPSLSAAVAALHGAPWCCSQCCSAWHERSIPVAQF